MFSSASDFSDHDQNYNNEQDESQSAARSKPPRLRVWPTWERTEDQQHQHDYQNHAYAHGISFFKKQTDPINSRSQQSSLSGFSPDAPRALAPENLTNS
jgi:hypothetical protein